MAIQLFRRPTYSDAYVVDGLQHADRKMEEWFYYSARRYFDEHFNDVFFDKDRKQEVFQSAFLKLWTEIANRKIKVVDNVICRQQANGEYKPMTCNLTTFLMTFAKNENREIIRNIKEVYVEDLSYGDDTMKADYTDDEDIREQQWRIIDDCINSLSAHCIEIVTLFYHQHKSLDEIMTLRHGASTTKTGLKSAKAKCMATLKAKARAEMERYKISC